jgi:hypothetical protein
MNQTRNSIAVVSQQAFFSEDNLFVLLNVVHDTVGDPTEFDKTNHTHRQALFEAMTAAFRTNRDRTLNEVNKIVLKEVYTRTKRPPSTSTNRAAASASDAAQPIRDAAISRRTLPTVFQERPQQSGDPLETSASSSASTSAPLFESAVQDLENRRNADTHQATTAVDFGATNKDDDDEDNADVMARMNQVTQLRETEASAYKPMQPAVTGATTATATATAAADGAAASLLSDALVSFDAQTMRLDETVESAAEAGGWGRQQHESAFLQATHYQDQDQDQDQYQGGGIGSSGGAANGRSHTGAELRETGEALLGNPVLHESDMSSTQLGAEMLVQADVGDTQISELEFQKALQMGCEQQALDAYLQTSRSRNTEDLLLIPQRMKYVNTMHYLEVSSGDRVRTIPTSPNADTSYSFTVHFNSARPSYRVYPVYVDHYIEDAVDYRPDDDSDDDDDGGSDIPLNTMEVRRCRGLRGMPVLHDIHHIDNANIVSYETVQVPSSVAGPNVDTVFYNVIALQLNYVQIYFPYTDAPLYPYILLEIPQYGDVYRSSNTDVRKSFCKLFYDRSSAPTTGSALYHMYVPMNREKRLFPTPLASIERLSFNLYNSLGQPLDVIRDVYHLKGIYLDVTETNAEKVCLVLQSYVPSTFFTIHNQITFENCIEWYNKDWYLNWLGDPETGVGYAQLQKQQQVEKDYYTKLKAHRGDGIDMQTKLKEDYASQQVSFDYPTVGFPVHDALAGLRSFLMQPAGHFVSEVGKYTGDVFTAVSSDSVDSVSSVPEYINCICIRIPQVVDDATGETTALQFGETVDGNDGLRSLLSDESSDSNGDAVKTYSLVTCTLLNNSVCTNISMGVYTRDEENGMVSQNI